MVAEFEADLISMRTREGMKVAKAKGRLRGKQPKLTECRPGICWSSSTAGTTAPRSWPTCSVGRSTIYRTVRRIRPLPIQPERPFARTITSRQD